ncbi:MAG: hypothetical protein NTX50_03895 [Candidatus Sumerlaeota bacterium]|nr:hypothetical protein [Candidatus Sumerlaeota bacterium]
MNLYRKAALAVVACALIVSFGCASIATCKAPRLNGCALSASGDNVEHINARCTGWYLLFIPLLTGDTAGQGWIPLVLTDTVTVDEVGSMLTAQAKADKATKVVDLYSSRQSVPFFPIPLLFSFDSVQMSGNAIK